MMKCRQPVSTGSATQPLMRSSTTEANVVGVSSVLLGQAGDPEGVAPDRARQDVAHELAGEVQRQQPVERRVQAERREHRAPSGRRTARSRPG